MYCNGPNEHYIDLACPFGKTNSALEFCPPVELFAKSIAVRYSQKFSTNALVLGTHVDDIFGGFKAVKAIAERVISGNFFVKWVRRLR